jgi:enolase-phosphatase E1
VTADVIDVRPETPNLDAMLAKFSREHWHDEDEVRFILEGRGVFHVHPQDGPVFAIEVGPGDLIRVPRGTWHWFDLCADRRIRAIRLFQDPSGWTPHYTGSGAEQGREPVCLGPASGLGRGMTQPPVAAFLLDVEGTTTPIDFVYRVLFPYARDRFLSFLSAHAGDAEVAAEVRALGEEHQRDLAAGHRPPPWEDTPEGAARYALWLMDRDRKATALKDLQGRIWEQGFAARELEASVYDDVTRALARWQAAGQPVAIYSSGSIRAQKQLFAHTQAGDLTPRISAFFDTTTGFKTEPDSYLRIAQAMGQEPAALLFVSDVAAELDAARAASLQTALCARSDTRPMSLKHRLISTFDRLP